MKKMSKKIKKVTIDGLAIMVSKGFENVEAKMATKEDLKNLEERMNGKFEGVNRRIDDMSMNRVKYEDRSKLKSRVDFIEGKMK